MPRSAVAMSLVLVVALVCSAPAQACGDKFLVPGRAPEFGQAFAANQPGHILIYRNPSSEVARSVMDDNLRDTLQRVGHMVEIVETPEALRRALDSSDYDIVLADVQDVPTVEGSEHGASPVMLPVVYKASWTEVNKLKQVYQLILNAPSRVSQTVTLIDEAMNLSRAAARAAG